MKSDPIHEAREALLNVHKGETVAYVAVSTLGKLIDLAVRGGAQKKAGRVELSLTRSHALRLRMLLDNIESTAEDEGVARTCRAVTEQLEDSKIPAAPRRGRKPT